MKIPFTVEKKVTLGELITTLSILASSISVLVTWRYEQKIQVKENATRTRVEIARTLNTINQVIQIQLSFYELIEEDIVESSRICVVDKELIKSRDFMWERFYKHRAELQNIISQNDWEVAYTNLLTHGIVADSIYIKSIGRLKSLQKNQFDLLIHEFETEILAFTPSSNKQTSFMIDKLRRIKNGYAENHKDYAKRATADLTAYCLGLIRETDRDLLFIATSDGQQSQDP